MICGMEIKCRYTKELVFNDFNTAVRSEFYSCTSMSCWEGHPPRSTFAVFHTDDCFRTQLHNPIR